MFVTSQLKKIFVVKTNQQINRHHGLRTNTSPHLLTFNPGPGDEIVAVARLTVKQVWEEVPREDAKPDARIVEESARLELEVEVNPVYDKATDRWSDDRKVLTLSGHPGRACSLGEDTYEPDTGEGIEDLILEALEANLEGWRYAPVSAEFLDYFTPADGTVIGVKFERVSGGENPVWKIKNRRIARGGDYQREEAK